MSELNITDAAGHDYLPNQTDKENVLAPETQYLICFEHDQMLLLWKLAKISILFKSGDRFDAKNYRPVVVLPAMYKIIEMIVIGWLKKHELYDEILAKQDEGKTLPLSSWTAWRLSTQSSTTIK